MSAYSQSRTAITGIPLNPPLYGFPHRNWWAAHSSILYTYRHTCNYTLYIFPLCTTTPSGKRRVRGVVYLLWLSHSSSWCDDSRVLISQPRQVNSPRVWTSFAPFYWVCHCWPWTLRARLPRCVGVVNRLWQSSLVPFYTVVSKVSTYSRDIFCGVVMLLACSVRITLFQGPSCWKLRLTFEKT